MSESEKERVKRLLEEMGIKKRPFPGGGGARSFAVDFSEEMKNWVEIHRVSGDCPCPDCGELYRRHPHDQNELDWDGHPFLRVACDGRRLKL